MTQLGIVNGEVTGFEITVGLEYAVIIKDILRSEEAIGILARRGPEDGGNVVEGACTLTKVITLEKYL